MKLFIPLLLISSLLQAQSTYYIRADTIRFQKTNGNTTFFLENATRAKTGGYLRNYGNGRTDFYYAIDSASVSGGNLTLWRGGGTQNIVVGVGGADGLQDVIINDPVLTQDNTIDVGANLLKFKDILDIEINRWGHEGFYFGQRVASIGMPVVRLKPRNGNTQMSFDIYPRGNPNDTFGIGKAWFDVVNTDFDSLGTGNTIKLAAASGWVSLGQSNYGVAAIPLHFLMGDGNIVGSMNIDDSWTLGKTTEHNIKIFKDSTLFLYGTGTQEAMRITNAGVVTITGANALKYVDGNEGALKVLTSDANGVASWQTPTGGTSGIDDVLAVGQSLSAIRTITVGGHQLILSGTASPTTLNVSNTGGGGVIWAQAATGVPITSQLNTTATNARQISILHTAGTTGTAANGFGVGESYSAEHAGGGAAVNIGEFYYYWADATNRTSYINLVGDSVALQSTYLQLQPNGIALVNNLNDTLATKAYARSVGGGGGGWGTTGTVATLTGDATLAQDGNDFVFSGGPVIINETGGDFVFRVEGNGEANLITTYPAFNRVGIGMATPAYKFQVRQNTDKNIGIGSQGSEISIEAVNDAVNAAIPLGIYGSTVSVSGGGVQAILASSSEVAFNEAGADLDFRFESDALTEAFRIDGSTGEPRMAFLAGTGSRAVVADAEGDMSAPVSDRSVKENIRRLHPGINEIMKLKPVSFEYKNGYKNYGTGTQMGFIAQDIQKIFPNSVYTNYSNGKMGYNATDLIPVLVKAVQDQQKQINKLTEVVKILMQKK